MSIKGVSIEVKEIRNESLFVSTTTYAASSSATICWDFIKLFNAIVW